MSGSSDCFCCTAVYSVLIAVGLVFLVKWIMQRGQYKKSNRVDGKVVIVTGCNTGIGKETVLELAKRGATVYMACRDIKKAEEAREEIVQKSKNKNVFCRKCDLASLESIRSFVEGFKSEQTQLHILINNGGVMGCPLMRTKDGFEMHLGVNHMGHFYLTNLLLDLLKQSAPSRIVVVSSQLHKFGKINVDDLNSEKSFDSTQAYAQSKLANVLFTKELARRLEGTGVTVNALHPGVVDSDLHRQYFIFNNPVASVIFKPFFWAFFRTVESGAQTSIYAALDPDLEKVSGLYFDNCQPKAPAAAAKDMDSALWLWNESEKWTGLSSSKASKVD